MDISELAKQDPEKIKQLISLLSSLVENTEDIKHTNKNIKTNNKFCDMAEFTMHKDDVQIDKQLHSKNINVSRNRPANIIDARCRMCGKTEKINPSIIGNMERYKCNKCSATPG